MWALRTRLISRNIRLAKSAVRGYASSTTQQPRLGATIAITASITAGLCYAYGTGSAKVWADSETAGKEGTGHYADATTATKGVENEVSKESGKYASKATIRNVVIPRLKELFAGDATKVSDDDEERLGHAHAGGTHHHPATPDVVVYVESTEDVVKVIKLASEHRVPVVPFSGESVEEF
jgi:D-lactate dehydrogenase (cytochrome)